MNSLRLLMLGTGPFAVPTFQALLSSPHQMLGLVTRPDRPAHRREKTPVNPMREVARQNSLEVFEPASINSVEAHAWLRDHNADLFVVCDYGQILSRESLSLSRLGGINLHASLLPKYRGAAPINWAIYHGEMESGVTVIHMTPQLDAGPAFVQKCVAIEPAETAPQLEARLAELGADAVLEAIAKLAGGEADIGIAQDPKLATKAPRLKKEDGLINWSRSAVEIFNQVRALQPWPKSYTFWNRAEEEPLRLIVDRAQPLESTVASAAAAGIFPLSTFALKSLNFGVKPGTVIEAHGENLLVACGKGMLRIETIQPAGKRLMTAAEFLCGHPLQSGQCLG